MENDGYHNESHGDDYDVVRAAVWGVVSMAMHNHMVKGMVEKMEVWVASHKLHNMGHRREMEVHADDSQHHDSLLDELEGLQLQEV